MSKTLAVTSWTYSAYSRYLKIFYENGSGDFFHPVQQFIYDNLLRRSDKAALVSKYLAYDLSFNRISIQLFCSLNFAHLHNDPI